MQGLHGVATSHLEKGSHHIRGAERERVTVHRTQRVHTDMPVMRGMRRGQEDDVRRVCIREGAIWGVDVGIRLAGEGCRVRCGGVKIRILGGLLAHETGVNAHVAVASHVTTPVGRQGRGAPRQGQQQGESRKAT